MTDREQFVENGKRAHELLQDEVLLAALEQTRQKYHSDWKNGKTTLDRENAWHRLHALEDVVNQLNVTVGRGQMAQAELDRQAARANQ